VWDQKSNNLGHSRTGVNLYEQKGNTMRLVFGLVLIIGVGLAGFAVYMAQGFISQMTAERDMLLAARAKAKPTVEIYAVTTPKAYGETLSKEDVTKIIWQEDSVPEGAFMKEEELFPEGKDARYVLRQMETFEQMQGSRPDWAAVCRRSRSMWMRHQVCRGSCGLATGWMSIGLAPSTSKNSRV
jgi:hypothetical protein